MLVSLMQFVTDLTPPPQLVAVWAEERGFAGLYVPEKTHVPIRSVVLDMVEEFIDTVGQLQGLVQR